MAVKTVHLPSMFSFVTKRIIFFYFTIRVFHDLGNKNEGFKKNKKQDKKLVKKS